MSKIMINNKEYDLENLPKEAIDLINSIAFVDAEIQKIQNQIKVYQAARTLYSQQLNEILNKLNNLNDDKISFS